MNLTDYKNGELNVDDLTTKELKRFLPEGQHHMTELTDAQVDILNNKTMPELIESDEGEMEDHTVKPDWVSETQWLMFHSSCYTRPNILKQRG